MSTLPTQLNAIRESLTAIGVPEILENPEALAQLPDEHYEALLEAYDSAIELAEANPENTEVIDVLYTVHMTLSSARYLTSIVAASEDKYTVEKSSIVKAWSGHPLQPLSKDDFKDTLLPSETIDVLTTIGLPEYAHPGLQFDSAITSVTLDPEVQQDEETADYLSAFWRIGETAEEDVIALDERGDGVVVALDREWGFFSLRYINASVSHLLVTLQAWNAVEEAEDDNLEQAIDTFEEFLSKVDPGALVDGSYWSDMMGIILSADDIEDDIDEVAEDNE